MSRSQEVKFRFVGVMEASFWTSLGRLSSSCSVCYICCSDIAKRRLEPVKYFDDIAWPAYLRWLEEQRQDGSDVGKSLKSLKSDFTVK